jgi:CheY-like chemotaxis protein
MKHALVLLVDADADTRTILRHALEHEGFRVMAAADGAEGLALAREHGPEIIVGDFPLNVPGHAPFTGDIRADARLRDTKVLSVTTRALDQELEAARQVADEVLVKPVEPQVVVAAVQRLLARKT